MFTERDLVQSNSFSWSWSEVQFIKSARLTFIREINRCCLFAAFTYAEWRISFCWTEKTARLAFYRHHHRPRVHGVHRRWRWRQNENESCNALYPHLHPLSVQIYNSTISKFFCPFTCPFMCHVFFRYLYSSASQWPSSRYLSLTTPSFVLFSIPFSLSPPSPSLPHRADLMQIR